MIGMPTLLGPQKPSMSNERRIQLGEFSPYEVASFPRGQALPDGREGSSADRTGGMPQAPQRRFQGRGDGGLGARGRGL